MAIEWAGAECQAIFAAALAAAEPERLVREALRPGVGSLRVRDITIPLRPGAQVVVVAIGKASVAMASGAVGALGGRITGGLVVTKQGTRGDVAALGPLRVLESSHPVPDAASQVAGEAVLAAVSGLGPDDVLLALISGGGSALVEAPVDDVGLDEIARTTELLLRAGADIQMLNAVRQRLSRIKGGGLARAASPARVVNLIVSDVLGNPLHSIASGPTIAPDQPRALDTALRSLGVWDGLPPAVAARLQASPRVQAPSAPLLGSVILADAAEAARAAASAAESLGYHAQVIGTGFDGEARELARSWVALVRHARAGGRPFRRPACLVGAGETTVTVRGAGRGGRNTEMALAAALHLEGLDGVAVASLATDGDDGDSGAAGGVVDGQSAARMRAAGLDPQALLDDNDSARALAACDGLIATGPTGTNVNDLYLALVR